MRIGFSFVDLALGGAQIFLVQLAEGLAIKGNEINFYLHARDDDEIHITPDLMLALEKIATRIERPDSLLNNQIVHFDGYHSLRRKLPYILHMNKCVETYHSYYSVKRSGPIYARHRVAISKHIQQELPLPSKVIYIGIQLPDDQRFPLKTYDVAILGRIHPVKQHMLFLDVCKRLYKLRGCLRVLIIGGHPKPSAYQEYIDAEIASLIKIGVQITLTGDIPPGQVFNWLPKTHILLVTSEDEGFGRMALEALACHVPVIANPVGGLKEIIIEGQHGFFAAKDDAQSFAQLSLQLLEDKNLQEAMGNAGHLFVKNDFAFEKMVCEYESLYQEIIQAE